MNAARHLRFGDKILKLDAKGQIVSISSLDMLTEEEPTGADVNAPEDQSAKEAAGGDNPVVQAPGPDDKDLMDRTRRTGDIAVYKYYIKSFGIPLKLAFLAANIASAFFGSIIRK